jgi:DNA processing protein
MRAPRVARPDVTGMSERDAWLALATTHGVAEETMAMLLASFGQASEVLAAAESGTLRRWAGSERRHDGRPVLTGPVLEALERRPREAETMLDELHRLGLWALTPLDQDYPNGLTDLDPAPAVLFGQGQRSAAVEQRAVAVVGTRRPTAVGRALAARICVRLVEMDAVVVSGLAVGIDGAAHAASLDAGGRTVGVIGGGHLHPGPRAHDALRRRVVDLGGAILSEHLPGTRPSRGTYPRRNRIIAALATATIVVDAPVRSGALITARHALDLGRTVLIAPGRVGDWASAGALHLLHDSPAIPIPDLDTLVDDIRALEPWRLAERARHEPVSGQAAALDVLDGAQRAVAEVICAAPAGLDRLVAATGLPPAAVAGAVTMLQMRGWVQPVGPAFLPAGALLGDQPDASRRDRPLPTTAGTSVP